MMLHLAQVHQPAPSEPPELKLLAAQANGSAWTVLTGEVLLPPDQAAKVQPAQLVLADLTPDREVIQLQDAKDWVLEILQNLHETPMPAMLQEEVERAEQWRQSLTLQSQELDRRALEMEARREQIQELEENLKQERRDLEIQREQLDQAKQQLADDRS
ncbi:MAG: hypothetical protein RLZZ511_3320 [Cyanobacteriota bacterium]|jgi:chromosome segregation ATPase